MKKKIFAMGLSLLFAACCFPKMSFAAEPAENVVAKVNGKTYATLKEAVDAAPENSTVTLLSDVTEDVIFNKNITVDGASKYTISGASTVKAGTLTNLTLKPNETNTNGKLLTIGNGDSTSINLENVTIHYSVTKRSSGSAVTVSGNSATIKINHCRFINTPNNNGTTTDAPEWSYGLYVNEQNDAGSITFTNNEFNGAFRTMLANVSGNFLIENCEFINSVYSVANGPTGGSAGEATTITTSAASNNQIVVKNNMLNNAGSIYLQTQANFTGNTIKNDKFEHYIQAKGSIGQPIDFKNNTFQLGTNNLVVIDVAATPILLPAGQPAVNYWIWSDTPANVRPADYSDYKYMYNEDGSITFMPQSDVAFEQFFAQKTNGNIQVNDQDTVLIEKNLKINDIEIDSDKNITFEIAKDATLEIAGALDIQGKITVKGEGALIITEQGKVNIYSDAALTVSPDTSLKNNGFISNNGELTIPDTTTGNGTIEGTGITEKVHNAVHVEAKEPTCDTDGNIEYWYCSFCDKYFSDKALTQEISKEKTSRKALGHKYENGKCTVCGKADPNYKPETSPTDNENDGNSNQEFSNSHAPKTGDNNHIGLMIALMLGASIAFFGVKRDKKQHG